MSKYEVTTDLIVHVKIVVEVDAEDGPSAIDAAADILPANYDMDRSKNWRATVELKPPKGIKARVVKAYHFEQASGSDKAKKMR